MVTSLLVLLLVGSSISSLESLQSHVTLGVFGWTPSNLLNFYIIIISEFSDILITHAGIKKNDDLRLVPSPGFISREKEVAHEAADEVADEEAEKKFRKTLFKHLAAQEGKSAPQLINFN